VKGERIGGTWERSLRSESLVVYLLACSISVTGASGKSSRWEFGSLDSPSPSAWLVRASPFLPDLTRRCPSCACSSFGSLDERGH
jgi:hypothetical protein